MARKKDAKGEADLPEQIVNAISEADYQEFVKYLTVRNENDPRVSKYIVECFVGSMNGEHVHDLRDIIEIYIKLDRHAGEYWALKQKRNSH